MRSRQIVRTYYAATILFLALDVAAGLNVRVAFLDGQPAWRAAYYAFCFACLAVTYWRPALSELVGATESLVALSALIVSFGSRVMLTGSAALGDADAVVTMPEVMNFGIAAGIAYIGWTSAANRIMKRS